MDTWYYSPFPEPYASCHKLYICEYSLKYFRKKATLLRHLAKLRDRCVALARARAWGHGGVGWWVGGWVFGCLCGAGWVVMGGW
jgi:hypothetical protein